MSSIRYLSRQGTALKGHNEENSTFVQLLNLLAEDEDNLKEWLLRKCKKYTSPIIQNEILRYGTYNFAWYCKFNKRFGLL